MVVISVTITESTEQVVAGIPKTVAVSTNVPSTIFYTLDGTVPTLFSSMYTGPIFLPVSKLSVTLSVFATNGMDSSPVVTETYITNMLGNTRLPHSATDQSAEPNVSDLYPFGTPAIQPNAPFLSPALAGITVDAPEKPSTSTGFDGAGNQTGFTDQPYNIENYQIVYSTTDALGQTGLGVGNLPAITTVKPQEPEPETTQQFSNMFDPRAFVIFQDFDSENPNDPPQINRQFFTLEDPNKARDGNHYFTAGLDAPPVSGSFLRSHYNPRDNTISYYYLDTWTNKWIISKQQFKPTGSFDGNLAAVPIAGREAGSRYVFQWVPFARRVLF
jgi:hypothetical protein